MRLQYYNTNCLVSSRIKIPNYHSSIYVAATLEIPNKVLGTDSLLVTIAVDNRDAFCSDTFLYIADVTSFKLVVYDVKNRDAWRVGSDYFYPFPMDGRFNINGVSFNLMDGILALALGM